MALLTTRSFSDTILELPDPDGGLEHWNHVLEPEYHQARYVGASVSAASAKGAFQLNSLEILKQLPTRGVQPAYADDENDVESLTFGGMIRSDGTVVPVADQSNVCALKSISIRWGYIDFSAARSVTRDFYNGRGKRAWAVRDDLLINSTGDGTIGRVAIFDEDLPAMVDGHITIVRFNKPQLAWYTAAYLLSRQGQDQIYRFINGSSGQVEIYPQDIARLWIPGPGKNVADIANGFQAAVRKHKEFSRDMRKALSLIEMPS